MNKFSHSDQDVVTIGRILEELELSDLKLAPLKIQL